MIMNILTTVPYHDLHDMEPSLFFYFQRFL